jgi:hypothetical protein
LQALNFTSGSLSERVCAIAGMRPIEERTHAEPISTMSTAAGVSMHNLKATCSDHYPPRGTATLIISVAILEQGVNCKTSSAD